MRSVPDVSDPAGPIGGSDRTPALDALRGFALLGIVLVNLRLFSAPLSFDPGLGPEVAWGDRIAAGAVTVLAEGRFYPLFAFLLGYGFTVAQRRAVTRGAYTDRHLRRSAALFALGFLHAALLFAGDILSPYAVLGLGLLAAVHWSDRTVLALSGALLVLGALVYGGLGALPAAVADDPEVGANLARDAQVYAAGSFGEVAALRLGDWLVALLSLPLTGVTIGAAMLAGHWCARRRLLEDPGAHAGLLRRLVVVGLPLGLAGGLAHAVTLSRFPGEGMAGVGTLAATGVLNHVAGALLTGAYIGIAGLVAARRASAGGGTPLRAGGGTPLRAAGRLALSNYLGQSLVCSLVFAGYGLGLYGRLGPAQVVVFGVALWVVQLALSLAYLRVFVMGPVEWLLRWVTYQRRPVLRRTA